MIRHEFDGDPSQVAGDEGFAIALGEKSLSIDEGEETRQQRDGKVPPIVVLPDMRRP